MYPITRLILISREEGIRGLWKGLGPNVARNAIINAAELASYDQVKQSLLASGFFKDNVVTHILSGLGAGFFAVCLGSPVDVVKSRVMGERMCFPSHLLHPDDACISVLISVLLMFFMPSLIQVTKSGALMESWIAS